jgi:hypothetical protein
MNPQETFAALLTPHKQSRVAITDLDLTIYQPDTHQAGVEYFGSLLPGTRARRWDAADAAFARGDSDIKMGDLIGGTEEQEMKETAWKDEAASLVEEMNTAEGLCMTVLVDSKGEDLVKSVVAAKKIPRINIKTADAVEAAFERARRKKQEGWAVIFVRPSVFISVYRFGNKALNEKFWEFIRQLDDKGNSKILVVFEIPVELTVTPVFLSRMESVLNSDE